MQLLTSFHFLIYQTCTAGLFGSHKRLEGDISHSELWAGRIGAVSLLTLHARSTILSFPCKQGFALV